MVVTDRVVDKVGDEPVQQDGVPLDGERFDPRGQGDVVRACLGQDEPYDLVQSR
jgi:hypothetical protein